MILTLASMLHTPVSCPNKEGGYLSKAVKKSYAIFSLIFISSQVLVKKSYADKIKRKKRRNWRLKGLAKDTTSIDPDALLRYVKSANFFHPSLKIIFKI